MRERWGAFSVRDHVSDAAFVSDVLLYDRLIIPVPDPADNLAEKHWVKQGWQPDLLHECLDVLKVKTKKADGLALTVPWDASKEERFKSRMSMAAALATQRRSPKQAYYMDPFHMTRMLAGQGRVPPGTATGRVESVDCRRLSFRRRISARRFHPGTRPQNATRGIVVTPFSDSH